MSRAFKLGFYCHRLWHFIIYTHARITETFYNVFLSLKMNKPTHWVILENTKKKKLHQTITIKNLLRGASMLKIIKQQKLSYLKLKNIVILN